MRIGVHCAAEVLCACSTSPEAGDAAGRMDDTSVGNAVRARCSSTQRRSSRKGEGRRRALWWVTCTLHGARDCSRCLAAPRAASSYAAKSHAGGILRAGAAHGKLDRPGVAKLTLRPLFDESAPRRSVSAATPTGHQQCGLQAQRGTAPGWTPRVGAAARTRRPRNALSAGRIAQKPASVFIRKAKSEVARLLQLQYSRLGAKQEQERLHRGTDVRGLNMLRG